MEWLVSYKGYVFGVPMKSDRKFPEELRMFAKEVDVPLYLIADPHTIQKSK